VIPVPEAGWYRQEGRRHRDEPRRLVGPFGSRTAAEQWTPTGRAPTDREHRRALVIVGYMDGATRWSGEVVSPKPVEQLELDVIG
jgi:hypothetical protein